MAYAPELDARPTVVAPERIGTLYDAALDGEPLLLEWRSDLVGISGYSQQSDKIGIEQTSTSDDISENKLSPNEFWRSMRDFQGGYGQNRFDVPQVSRRNAYRSSNYADTRDPGELSTRRLVTVSAPGTLDWSAIGPSSDVGSNGVWFTSQNTGGPTQAVTFTDLSTFTTKTFASALPFNDLTVAPDDVCYLAHNNGVYKVTVGTSITQWSAQGGWKILAAKGRLYLATSPVANPPKLYEVPTEGTPPVAAVAKYSFAPNTDIKDMKEAGGLILIATAPFNATNQNPVGPGVVYAYDGTNAPYPAVVLSKGEQVDCIYSAYGGSIVLLFARRLGANGKTRGLIYQTRVNSGTLDPAELVWESPLDHSLGGAGASFPMLEAAGLGGFVYFPGLKDDVAGTGFGVDAFNLAEGTVSHDAMPPAFTGNPVQAITAYAGRLVWFAYDGTNTPKVFTESDTLYALSSVLTTSAIDLNVDAPKQWTGVEAACLPLQSGTKVEVWWSADRYEAQDFRLAGTLTRGQTRASFPLPASAISRQLTLQVKLISTNNSFTPTLVKLGVGAQMARMPKLQHALKVRAYARMERLDRAPLEQASEGYFNRLAAHFEGLRHTGRLAWLQSPHSSRDGHADLVKVDQVIRRMLDNPARGGGGELEVSCANVLPDRRNLWPLAVASFASLPITLAVADVFEAIGAATLTLDAGLASWTRGSSSSATKVTPGAVNQGVRWPKVHQTTVWDPVLYRGLPLSVGVLVNPYAANLKLQFTLELWDGGDTLRKSVASQVRTFSAGEVGKWLPMAVENVTTDDVMGFGLLYPTGKVVLDASSAVAAFAFDAPQAEQAKVATRWQAPPSAY